jgi:hypothetical protein
VILEHSIIKTFKINIIFEIKKKGDRVGECRISCGYEKMSKNLIVGKF